MKAILLDEAQKWLEVNCENQYTRMAVFGIMQSMPMVDYQDTPNELLTCNGCRWAEMGALEKCASCKRDKHDNYYRRPPEGEEEP